MRCLAYILILLPVLAFGKTPVDFKKWQLDDTTFSKQIGGSVRNYEKPDKAWAEIVNDFEIEGDSVVYVDQSVLKARVNKDGVCRVTLTWEDQEYTVTQKLLGIGWIKISTRQSLWIDSTMNWSNFSVNSNIAKWTGISPGVDYRVLKGNGRVAHGIFFKPAFLDSAVILYNQREDSLDIALANVMVYTLSSNIDNADSAIGDLSKRRLKDFGYYTFNLGDQRLRFPGSDTLPRVPVRQYWERRETKIICIEYVMMSKIKKVHEGYPSATVWHNDTKTIDGTTNLEDAYLVGLDGYEDKNYGGSISYAFKPDRATCFRVKNVASELGPCATISAVICSLYNWSHTTNGNISTYRIFKPWNEGALNGTDPDDAATGEGVATWNDWSNDDEEWTTAGCGSADDGGSDNSGDGTGADRKATAEGTTNVTSTGWWVFSITAALGQAWYAETANENGVVFIVDSDAFADFRSTEYTTDPALQPYWVFTYTTVCETFYLQHEDDVEDTYIKSTEATTNYGSGEDLVIGSGYSQVSRILMRFPYLCDSINDRSDVVVKSVDIMLYYDDGVSLGTIYAYYLSKAPWEDEATYNRWEAHLAHYFEWGTAGAADTGSVWNEGDGTGDDRGGTSQGSVAVDWEGWNYLSIDTGKINDWLRADSANSDTLDVPAWIIQDDGAASLQWFHSSEYPTDTSLTARLRVILTAVPVGGPPNVRHGPEGTGQRHGPDGPSVRHEP